ncbi:MAG TPA: SRPBCC family protein, partial [Gemmatimonadales bacterium]
PRGPNRLHWTARGPASLELQWDAEIVDDRPNERIAWRSLPGGDIESNGAVEFRPAPGTRGTEVIMELRYDPPGGRIVERLAQLFGKPLEVQIERDLRAFKQIMEVGEVVHSDASIHRGSHPARPANESPRIEQ